MDKTIWKQLANDISAIDTKEKEKRERLERFTQFFNRVNSAFAFRKVIVKVDNSPMNAPAWSNATEITFNSNQIGELNTPRDIACIKGLNLHELSHVLFTSREGSEIVDYVMENKLFQAFNALEDCRIETLFTTRYPSTIDWFTATILIHFAENQEHFNRSYPLLCGRRYLPVEIRTKSRMAYVEPQNADEIADIVNEYRTLIFPADTEKGKELIRRFADLLPKGDGTGNGHGHDVSIQQTNDPANADVIVRISDPFGHGSRPSETIESTPTSRPLNPKQQQKVADKAKKDSARNNHDDKELAEKLANKPVIDMTQKQFDSLTNSDSQSQSDSKLDSDSDSQPESTGDSASNELGDLLDMAIASILNDSDNYSEIREIMNQISGKPTLQTNNSQMPTTSPYSDMNPDMDTLQASHLFYRSLERLQSKFDPAWERYESNGRLNIGRYIRGDEFDSLFDQWNEGIENATSIECVIALDNSGSMNGDKATNSYRAMYAIKRALDKIGANTSVFTWNTNSHTLYRADEKSGQTIRHGGTTGGTNPNDVLQIATKLLAETDKPVRIFFVITDGEWDNSDLNQNHEMIERMARAGVLTALAYIPEHGESVSLTDDSMHRCEVGAVVRNPMDLIGLANQLVHYAVTRRLVNN